MASNLGHLVINLGHLAPLASLAGRFAYFLDQDWPSLLAILPPLKVGKIARLLWQTSSNTCSNFPAHCIIATTTTTTNYYYYYYYYYCHHDYYDYDYD